MDNRCFKLKRSYCALAFQLFIFALLMYLLYQLLPIAIWLLCAAIGLVIYQLFYRKTPQIEPQTGWREYCHGYGEDFKP